MKFIPGDIVRYTNKTIEYRIELGPRGILHMRRFPHGGDYNIPKDADFRLIKVGHDNIYRVPRENLRRYMNLVSYDRASPAMREFVSNHESEPDSMDTSGFDALKKAGGDEASDAMRFLGMDFGTMEGGRTAVSIMSKLGQGKIKTNNINEENTMSISINSLVSKNTDNIKDAELVTRYFGDELNENSIKDEFFVRDNYEDLLNVAKAREEKRLADIKARV